MAFSVCQKVIYTSINGSEKEATILLRKVDFEEGYINTDYAKGGFDYLISVIGKDEPKFCNDEDLK
jgi:hypothetical protein